PGSRQVKRPPAGSRDTYSRRKVYWFSQDYLPAREPRMPLFSAKLDYALRAAVDLALQPPDTACQSREIAARQGIRGPYLDQILAVLKREGIVRSIRGAGGGYTLAQDPRRIRIGDVVRAVVGDQL